MQPVPRDSCYIAWMRRIAWTALCLAAVLGGCAGRGGPELVTVPEGEYAAAFDAALEAVRDVGMPAELIDRRGGVVETEYRVAGTVLEPWRSDGSDFSTAIETTVNHERRKVRIEFTPVRFEEPAEGEALTGPDVFGERDEVVDLTTFTGRIEVRAWVQRERATAVGRRRGDWTRRSTTVAIDPDSGLGPTQFFWTPVERDLALEHKLLAAIERKVKR